MIRPQTTAFASVADAKEAGQWFKDVANGVYKYGSEKTNTEGGFLVPDVVLNAIREYRTKDGVFRSLAQVIPCPTDSLSIPKRDSGNTVYYPGENATVTESQSAWDQIKVDCIKIASLVRASNELMEDTAFLGDWLIQEIVHRMEFAIDTAAFSGDGTSTYGGISGFITTLINPSTNVGAVTMATGHDTVTEIDYVDMASVVAALPSRWHDNAVWFCHQTFWGFVMARLAGSAGSDGKLMFMGYPVVLTGAMPTLTTTTDFTGLVMCGFGDVSRAAILGERRGINIKSSEERYLEYDQTTFLATARFTAVWDGLGNTSNAGAVVGLVGGT